MSHPALFYSADSVQYMLFCECHFVVDCVSLALSSISRRKRI